MSSHRKNRYHNELQARHGKKLASRIFGLQTREGERVHEAIKIPLRFVELDTKPERELRGYEEREARVLGTLEERVQRGERVLIDPNEVEWPNVG